MCNSHGRKNHHSLSAVVIYDQHFWGDIVVESVNGDQLLHKYSAANVTNPNKDGCNCSSNNTILRCLCSSFQSALNHVENNSVVYILTNSVTLQSKVVVDCLHNISIVGADSSTVECDNTGCLQFESCSNLSIENVVWNNCSCRNDALPAGISIQKSENLHLQNCKHQNSLSTAVYLENVCGTINFDHVSFQSNRKDALSNTTSTAGLEINNVGDNCHYNTLSISISNSLFSNNRNIKGLNCAYAGALQIHVHGLNHLNITIGNTSFTDNQVESGLSAPIQLFNGESSGARIWLFDVAKFIVDLTNVHFSSNNQDVWSLNKVNVLCVYADYVSSEKMKNKDQGCIKMSSCTFINNTANVVAYLGGFVNISVHDCSFMKNTILLSHLPYSVLNVETGKYSPVRINISQSNLTDNEGGPVLEINPNIYSNEFYFYVDILCFNLLISNNTLYSKHYFPVGLLIFDVVYFYTVVIQDVKLIYNHVVGVGGGLYFRKNIQDAFIYDNVIITGFVFENNVVSNSHGAAISISDSMSKLFTYSTKYFYNLYKISNSTFKNTIGGRSIVYSSNPILLGGNCAFMHNAGTAVYIIEQPLHITGNVTFDDNISEDGGAIYLSKSSVVTFTNQSTVKFANNVATRYGGAIFSDITNCSKISIIDGALVQAIEFNRNTAILAGDSIYYSLPQSCNHVLPNFPFSKNLLTTSPDKLVLQLPAMLNNSIYTVQDVMLGQQVSIPVCLQDFNGNATGTASFRVSILGSEFSINRRDLITVGCHDSHGMINLQISGDNEPKENTVARIKLTSFYSDAFDWKSINVNLSINLTQCHLGFKFDPKQKKCVCFTTDNIVTCSGSISEVKRGYWFGTVNNKSTATICPLNYCHFTGCRLETGICQLSSNIHPCRAHRHGAACGTCDNGYTLSYDSAKCIDTKHCSIGQTIFVASASSLFWIAAFVTIFAVMYFKLIIGYFYAITFYYSIIDILLGEIMQFSSGFCNMVMAISGIAKLTPQFLGKLCFVQGMSGIDQQFIHYIHPLAVLSSLFALSIAARYSGKLTSFVSRGGVINVICFILLLSYTSITSTSLLLMRPLKFTGIDQVYTYLSPDIEYFHGRHAVYAAVAIVCELIIVIGLPLLLLLQPFLNHRINFIRIMPLLDQFQSCYKNRFRWFASYYMICRQIIIAIIISDVAGDLSSLYMLFTACLIMALVHVTIKPYKSNKLNIFDGFVLHIILLVVALKIIDYSNGFSSHTSTTIAFILVLLPLSVYLMAVVVHVFPLKKFKGLLFNTRQGIKSDQSRLLGEVTKYYGTQPK